MRANSSENENHRASFRLADLARATATPAPRPHNLATSAVPSLAAEQEGFKNDAMCQLRILALP